MCCCCSVAKSRLTLCDSTNFSKTGFLVLFISQRLLKLISVELVMPSNHLILYCPLLLLPSIFPTIKVFFSESTLPIRCQSIGASASILPMKYTGLMSFRIDWFDVLAVQGTLKSLLQHHSLKASILLCSAYFMVQLSIHIWLLEKP